MTENSSTSSETDLSMTTWGKLAGMCPLLVTVERSVVMIPTWSPILPGHYLVTLSSTAELTCLETRDDWVFSHPGFKDGKLGVHWLQYEQTPASRDGLRIYRAKPTFVLPQWAKQTIKEVGVRDDVAMQNGEGGTLFIKGGVATFNGVRVAVNGKLIDPAFDEVETTAFEDLPDWAQEAINAAGTTHNIQHARKKDFLQVNAGVAHFNNKLVIK